VTNVEKYTECFVKAFELPDDSDIDIGSLEYQSIAQWDSAGHMVLIALLEDCFEIMLETDDIIDFSSFEKGKEIIKKYEVAM
jgi:acyl carrier protein